MHARPNINAVNLIEIVIFVEYILLCKKHLSFDAARSQKSSKLEDNRPFYKFTSAPP